MKKFIFSVVFLTVIRWKFINHHRIKITLPHLFRVSCFAEGVVRRNNDVLLVSITEVILSEEDSNHRVNLAIDHPIFPHFFENCPRFFYNGGVAAFSAFANLPLIKTVWKLRRRSKSNMSRKLKKFRKLLDRGAITTESIHQSYQSWKGHALRGNCHHLVREMDELYNSLFKEDNKDVSITVESADRGESQVR
uniref:Uncharacterized protein n=1 Tax=Siphoviridae sp. ctO0R2 TaxID=2825476 RepID=A0A8S5PD44_9CAUD|nr:MAG TPA: hypothetical protein [Siphoviridae sp. ctO0R2]